MHEVTSSSRLILMDAITVIVLISILGFAVALRFAEAAETDPLVEPTIPPPASIPREFVSGEWVPGVDP